MNYISCIFSIKNHQKVFGFHQKISSSLQTCHQIGIKTFYLHIFQIKDSESVKEKLKQNVDNELFIPAIEASLHNVDSDIAVTSPTVSDSIVADIQLIVDTKDSAVDITDANAKLSTELFSNGFKIEKAEGILRLVGTIFNNFICKKSMKRLL